MPQDIEIPGGEGKKLPGWVLLAGGAIVVLILIMKKGGGETTGEQDTSGLLASEMNQRLQEMQEALQQALEDAQGQAPGDQITPPAEPVTRPGADIPIWRNEPPGRFPPVDQPPPIPPMEEPTTRPGGGIPIYRNRPPGGGLPPSTGEPLPETAPAPPPRPGGGLPPRLRSAPIGTRTGHISRVRFIEEAGQPLTGHARAQAREKRSPALKSTTKKIIKQAPSSSQKMSKKGPTVKKDRKR